MLHGQEQNGEESGHTEGPAESEHDQAPGLLSVYVAGKDTSLEPVVEALGKQAVQLEGHMGSVVRTLERDPNARALILFPNPVVAIAGQLDEGVALSTALTAWREETEVLLAMFRRDRARITLMDGHAALGAPDEFSRQLETRLSLPAQLPEQALLAGAQDPAGLLHALAAQALSQNDAAGALQAELEASSLVLGPAYRLDIQALIDERAAPSSAPELSEIKEDNELLRLQLCQLQAGYESLVLEYQRLDESGAGNQRAKLVKQSVEADFSEAREAWREERKLLTDKLKWTADDLAAIRRSLSWRLTAPLRRILGIFLGSSKL